MSITNPVKQLNAETARKIAAGEVIDRPNAIVRELMDNAIDSGADTITVEISGGGIEKIRIVDNGCGMTKEDLSTCARPHATSKIANENDLLHLTTLGFRGEALSSISAVCRLSIISGGYKMRASVTEDHIIEQSTPLDGTIVQAEGLFENFPARRVFLKRPASEGLLCKNTFVEKSLPNPEKSFRFVADGNIKLDLPQGQTLTERFVRAYELKESPSLFYEISGRSSTRENPDWSFTVVIGEPGVFRTNKKDILIFVNGRRITEFSLMQAIEYGGKGYFPNGTFPVAAAFITVTPALVDFNIHPAKKEARFKDISSLHHGLSMTVKKFFESYTHKTMKEGLKNTNSPLSPPSLFQSKSPENLADEALSDLYVAESSAHKPYPQKEPYAHREKYAPSSIPGWKGGAKIHERYTINHTTDFAMNRAPNQFMAYTASHNYKTHHTKNSEAPSPIPSVSAKAAQARATEEFMDAVIDAYNGRSGRDIQNRTGCDTDLKDGANYFSYKKPRESTEKNTDTRSEFHFLGSALGTFLVAEKGNTLYIIDKHAADERYLFDQIMQEQGKRQNLLLPYIIETKNQDEDDYLESIKHELSKIGFDCENKGEGRWEFFSLNERWKGTELELAHDLLDKRVSPKDLIYSMAAMTACKAAVKDGWTLLDSTAEEIARRALELPDPHCPHGRPVYTILTREHLFELVKRT